MTIKDLERLKSAGLIRDYSSVEVINNPKKPKFGNMKTKIDGIVFDSAKEAARYVELRYLLKSGLISDLECQKSFQLNEGGTYSLKYVCDFQYKDCKTGEIIIEDVKGYKTKEYKKKKRLMEKVHGIIIKEV